MWWRVWKTLRTFAIALCLVLVFGFLAGARPVFAYRELRCDPGYTAHPKGLSSGVYQCEARLPDPTAIQWPQVVTTQDEVGLYLTNLHIRVFHINFVSGTYHWFALGVLYR